MKRKTVQFQERRKVFHSQGQNWMIGLEKMVMAETQESRDVMTLKEVYEAGRPEEEGYDAPFATFTWRHWMASQARLNQCFSRFVRAVEERRAAQAMLIGLEVQEIATQMLVEAYSLSVDRPEETDGQRSTH